MSVRTRRIVVALFAAFIVIMLVVSMVGPAGAHNDFGDIAIEVTSEPESPGDLTIRVRITYTDDGHPVEDGAVVTYAVTPTMQRPAAQGEMARVGEGQYEADVSLQSPGDYVISVVSADPEGTATVDYAVSFDDVSTTTTSAPGDPADDADSGDDDADSDEVVLRWPIVIAGLVFLGVVGSLIVVAVRRRA